jgi:hypothetical protein
MTASPYQVPADKYPISLAQLQEARHQAQKSKKAFVPRGEDLCQVKLVAGVGFEPTTFRL